MANELSSWYTVRTKKPDPKSPLATIPTYEILKFDGLKNYASSYTIEVGNRTMQCDCLAGYQNKYCRHKKILTKFQAEGLIDKGWMYNFDQSKLEEPVRPEDEGGDERVQMK